MLTSIVPERWRGPIVYVLMSVFVTWHAICLIVGPAPQTSVIGQALRPLVTSYLGLISLNVKWGFFAPIGSVSLSATNSIASKKAFAVLSRPSFWCASA